MESRCKARGWFNGGEPMRHKHESVAGSRSKVRAHRRRLSAIVRYGWNVSTICSTVRPNLTTYVAPESLRRRVLPPCAQPTILRSPAVATILKPRRGAVIYDCARNVFPQIKYGSLDVLILGARFRLRLTDRGKTRLSKDDSRQGLQVLGRGANGERIIGRKCSLVGCDRPNAAHP